MSFESFNNHYIRPYVSVFLKNVTFSSNINGYVGAITANMIALHIKNARFTSNTFIPLAPNAYIVALVLKHKSYFT